MPEVGLLRIGELSRRAGVSPELLRAWERRYGLLRPTRTPGGLRLYSSEDIRRVQEMQRHLADGLAAAQAAALASRAAIDLENAPLATADVRTELAAALHGLDEPAAQAILDRLFAVGTVEAALSKVILPYLRELGARWEREEVSVAQEHFASNVLRGRLLGLARGWGRGVGPIAMLACLPEEQHELGLIAFGLALRSHGWRISYFGGNTPLETVEGATEHLEPRLVALSAVTSEPIQASMAQLRELARRYRVALGGVGAADVDADELGVLTLPGDAVAEAERVTNRVVAIA
ncbi:MAG TPA: MerR family transcriptional regulator [Gaiellaceae bacterium]|nr:MerR family transcriptional regulator [Gaiellaceae bacterium]